MTKVRSYIPIFLGVLLLTFTKVQVQIDQLQKDFLDKSNEITLVLKFAILAQKW